MDIFIRLAILFMVGGGATWISFALKRYFAGGELPTRFDRADVELGSTVPLVVEFTSPFCYECQVAYPRLEAASKTHGAGFAVIDAKHRPDLTAKYAIRTTPTILVVDGKGKVTSGWLDTTPTDEELTRALQLAR